MRKEIADRWIEELDNYEKGKERLRDGDRYCCLGVLCDMYQRETKEGEWNDDDQFVSGQAFYIYILPEVVKNWAGLWSEDGYYGHERTLANLNDKTDTWEPIKEAIKKYWKDL